MTYKFPNIPDKFAVIHTDQCGMREWAIKTPDGEYLLYGKDCRQARADCKIMNSEAQRNPMNNEENGL